MDASTPSPLLLAPRKLAGSDIVFGGVWIGPGPAATNPDPGQDNADATVLEAVKAGIVEMDTAPWYGAGGSEERLGRAVLNLPDEYRSLVLLTTKAGRLFRQPDGKTPCAASFEEPGATPLDERAIVNDYTADGARISLRESCARLRVDRLYGLRIHDANDNSTSDGVTDEVGIALSEDGMCTGLRDLREQGVIQKASIGMNCNKEAHMGKPDQILRLITGAEAGTFDCALLAGGWNLLNQDGMQCFLECQNQGIAVQVAGVFCSGLLVGGDTYSYIKAPLEMVEKAQRWSDLSSKHGVSLPAVAIAFASLPQCVSHIVLGMATPEQVRNNMAAVEESNSVPVAIWSEARKLGLLPPTMPVPT